MEPVYRCETGEVTIPVEEYEKLLGDQRRVEACRNVMDEFYMKRKLLLDNKSDTADHQRTVSLRRVTLNQLSVRLDRGWNG